MKITDLENQSLEPWELMTLYSAARLHNTAGYYPLIEVMQKKMVMCPSMEVLETVWTTITPMYIFVQAGIFLVNKKDNIVISLNQDQSDIDSNMFYLVQNALHTTFINGSFGYAPGLLLTRKESEAKFPKTHE